MPSPRRRVALATFSASTLSGSRADSGKARRADNVAQVAVEVAAASEASRRNSSRPLPAQDSAYLRSPLSLARHCL
eukprot:72915-Pleurochrysis_carterae.AAC.1